ncbi:MAG TPA: gamma-glutamylcyclotransferase family protein [Terriglobales bacterium]|nr:gamma-glutamylcyclotransferase family protein [Terriglobales bacterium]
MELFVYGTLRDPELVRDLTGSYFDRVPAVLHGYRRIEMPRRYPWIEEADADHAVEGVLLLGLDPPALTTIDTYECLGELYRRIEVEVSAGATLRRCFTYVGLRAALLSCVRG